MTTTPESHIIYASFNARNLSPEEVAETFVMPAEFEDLILNEHALLMGPRGSGKTTLIKMLTPRALRVWKDPMAAAIRDKLAFSAVYIPTDIHWHHQLTYSETVAAKIHNDFGDLISKALVTTSVLGALVINMEERIQFDPSLESLNTKEEEVSSRLISGCMLPATIPTFSSIQSSLRQRIADINITLSQARFWQEPSKKISALPQWYYLSYPDAVAIAIDAFDTVFNNAPSRRWALCFDELELAPEWLQHTLMEELRSTNEKIIFKLSTSPIPTFLGRGTASPRDDYKVVRLWPYSGKKPRIFDEELTKSVLARNNIAIDPTKLFGTSPLIADTYTTGSFDEYKPNTSKYSGYNIIKDVAAWDHSLQALLSKHGLSPDDPTTATAAKRDQVLRKAKPIAFLRREFRKAGQDSSTRGRSRKNPGVYWGVEALYAIADGNPRWLIGLLDDMIRAVSRDSKGEPKQVPKKQQEKILNDSSRQFSALISTAPIGRTKIDNYDVSISKLINEIAEFFYDAIVIDDFTLDPPGSFIVDSWIPEEMVQILREAVYYGAIVFVDPMSHALEPNLKGKRFRLSYMLAPRYRLPLRLYDSVALSRCIMLPTKTKKQTSKKTLKHPKLPMD